MNGSSELLEAPPRPQPRRPSPRSANDRLAPENSRCARFSPCPSPTALAFGVHLLVSQNELPLETRYYSIFLGGLFGASVLAARGAAVVAGLRDWLRDMAPILAAAIVLLAVWEIDHLRPALAADALFSKPRGRAAQVSSTTAP